MCFKMGDGIDKDLVVVVMCCEMFGCDGCVV